MLLITTNTPEIVTLPCCNLGNFGWLVRLLRLRGLLAEFHPSQPQHRLPLSLLDGDGGGSHLFVGL